MKINFKLLLIASILAVFLPCICAQVTVVKQDGNKIYLDTSDFNRTIKPGDTFKIILSQEKLTNPKTGKELGLINHYSEEGKITEVQELYAIGKLPDQTKYKIGQEAVIENTTPPTSLATVVQNSTEKTTAPIAPTSNRKIKTYAPVEREIISAVQADLSALPGEEIAAIDSKGHLVLYTPEGNFLRQTAEHKLPVGKTPITLSAFDLMHRGYGQLFAVIYDEKTQKISTLVFDAQDNTPHLLDTLPYFVKELGCGEDKEIYAQKPFTSGTKAGKAYELDYENGRFVLDDDAFNTRGNWLTGLNRYEIQNRDEENLVYTASNGRLRVRLHNGKYADGPALFAQAPNRVKYKQNIISFYPSLQAYGPDGHATLAGVENTTKLGLLSAQFGQYNGGKIHFLSYENGTLSVTETVTLNGFLHDTNCTTRGILAPQVLPSGQTVLTEIYR